MLSVEGAEHRDEETWGWHLLDAMEQGFNLTTPSQMGYGTEGRQKAVMGEIPCHGDVFHIQHQCRLS